MWVYINDELSQNSRIIMYEYQKTRHSDHPKEFYKDFHGVLMTDGLEQYYKLDRKLESLINANCYAYARRSFANAIKAIGKSKEELIRRFTLYQALFQIVAIYKLEESLKGLSPKERLNERQTSVKPLVEEYFTWVKERLADTMFVPKGEASKSLRYSFNQEQ